MSEPSPIPSVTDARFSNVCPTCGAPLAFADESDSAALGAAFGVSAEAVAGLAYAVVPLTPSPDVKMRLMARVRASQEPSVPPDEPSAGAESLWRFASVGEPTGWLRPPVPGIRLKELSVDETKGIALLFVEIEPGHRFPDHFHDGAEFGLVLTGDVTSGGRLLRAGDYYETEPGSEHTDIVSPNGCTALLSVSAEGWRGWRSAYLVPAT